MEPQTARPDQQLQAGKPPREFNFSIPREPWLKSFFGSLRDFLVERPVKVRPVNGRQPFVASPFGAGLGENLKEWFRPVPKSVAAAADNSRMAIAWKPWYRSFFENLRDTIAPPKLPPLQVTSKPVAVKDIWSPTTHMKRVQAASFAVHAILIALFLLLAYKKVVQPTVQASNPLIVNLGQIDISPYAAKLPAGDKKAGGGGGGGEHNPLPASKGRLPKFSWTQFTPPKVKIDPNAKLQMQATVLGPPELKLPSPNMPNYGDPLSKLINDSSGPGSGSGIGTGCCGGVGSGQGAGVGPGQGWGTGGGPPSAGRDGYGMPVCVYCPKPEFSDEAVKAKYQGLVVLQAIILPDGRVDPNSIRVVKGLGLGLDEKVIETVRTWRFKPAIGPNGKPATVSAPIEVNFRLL